MKVTIEGSEQNVKQVLSQLRLNKKIVITLLNETKETEKPGKIEAEKIKSEEKAEKRGYNKR